ncbi:MAG: DUF1839 family protein [Pseudomonadota bacterium]|nr:DUF1839 family protein [Pseudomonadota bacterium]
MTVGPALPGIEAQGYPRHALHGEESAWPEKNCYVDLWIELLHSLALEPRAVLPFTLAVDFEGDQWTFFKPPLSDLRELYGIDVQELTVWRPLIDHAREHLAAGKLISTEADAFWLPDTRGTDYRSKHTKTTILLARLDVEGRRLGYFHNAGYFELSGEDFSQVFRLEAVMDPAFMPLYAELVRIERRVTRPDSVLAAMSFELVRRYVDWRPARNPFSRFAAHVDRQLDELRVGGLPGYHAWAFASIRQAGAAFELAAANLRWLASLGYGPLGAAAPSFDAISQAGKALILKGARAVHTGKALALAPLAAGMAQAWDEGMAAVEDALKPGQPLS